MYNCQPPDLFQEPSPLQRTFLSEPFRSCNVDQGNSCSFSECWLFAWF